MQKPFTADSTVSRPTRRQVLATGGAALAGGGALLTLGSRGVAAQVTMGELAVSGDDATVGDAPSEVMIDVAGEWSADAPSPPEQVRAVLQIHVDGSADDLAEQMYFDQSAGEYTLSTNLYDHRNVSQGQLTPDAAGETAAWELLVRVILVVVADGSIQAEEFVEDTAELRLTREGYDLQVGGSGSVTINSAD